MTKDKSIFIKNMSILLFPSQKTYSFHFFSISDSFCASAASFAASSGTNPICMTTDDFSSSNSCEYIKLRLYQAGCQSPENPGQAVTILLRKNVIGPELFILLSAAFTFINAFFMAFDRAN